MDYVTIRGKTMCGGFTQKARNFNVKVQGLSMSEILNLILGGLHWGGAFMLTIGKGVRV